MGNTQNSQHSEHMSYPTLSPSPMVAMVNLAKRSKLDIDDSSLTSRPARNNLHELDIIPYGEQIERRVGQEQHSRQEWCRQQDQCNVTLTRVQSLTDLLLNQPQYNCNMAQNDQYSLKPKSKGLHNLDINENYKADTNKDNSAVSQNDVVDNTELLRLQNLGDRRNITNQKEKLDSFNQIDSCFNVGSSSLEESRAPEVLMTQLSLSDACFEEMTEADQGSSFFFQDHKSSNDLVERGCSVGNNFCKFELSKPSRDRLDNSYRNCENEPTLNETLNSRTDDTSCKTFMPSASRENHADTQNDVCFQQKTNDSEDLIEVERHSVFVDTKTGECFSVVYGSCKENSSLPASSHVNKSYVQRWESYSSDGSSASLSRSKTSTREDLSTCGGVFFRRDSEMGSFGESYKSYSYEGEFEGSFCGKDAKEAKTCHDEILGQGDQSQGFGDMFLQTYPGTSVFYHPNNVILDRNVFCSNSCTSTSSLNKSRTECQPYRAQSRSNAEKNGSLPAKSNPSNRSHHAEGSSNTENRNAFSSDYASACSNFSWNIESSSEVYLNRSSSSGHVEECTEREGHDNTNSKTDRQNGDEGQRDDQPSPNFSLALSDIYRRFNRNYVACLCCAEDVWDTFGLSFHHLLEEEWGLPIFCELRDLDLSGPYHENITKCLEERCNGKIIVILSHSYANSEECLFLTYFAKTLDPDSRCTNIIPVMIDKDVEIPNVLRGLAIINYNHAVRCGWLKQKLITAIAA